MSAIIVYARCYRNNEVKRLVVCGADERPAVRKVMSFLGLEGEPTLGGANEVEYFFEDWAFETYYADDDDVFEV